MLLIRRFEERCVELYSATQIRGFLHLYIGEEAVATGVMSAPARRDDAVVSTYREHGHALARGVADGRGDGGDVRPADRVQPRPRRLDAPVRQARPNFVGGNAIVAGGIPLAVGLALADRMQGRDRVTACFFGDGAVAEGEFHEAMNLAALWQLPVLFCCENNRYAMGTALAKEHAQTDLALRASSYGMAAWPVDGMDVLAVEDAATRAVEEIRGGGAPVLPGAAHLPVPGALDVRPGPVPRQGGDRDLAGARPARQLPGADAEGGRARRGRARRARGRDRRAAGPGGGDRRRRRRAEPVEDLTRFVTSPAGGE